MSKVMDELGWSKSKCGAKIESIMMKMDKVKIKCSNWKRRKRKIKIHEDQGKGIDRIFVSPIKTT